MLKWLVVWVGLPVLIFAAVTLSASYFSISVPAKEHQYCLQAAQQAGNKKPECPLNETILDRALGAPIAFFTLLLVYFTGVLAVVGIGQGLLASEQIALARDEFNATHRPEIIIHSVKYAPEVHKSGDEDLDKIGAQVIFFNKGTGDATLKSINYNIEIRTAPLNRDIVLPSHAPRRADLASGYGDWVQCVSDIEIRMKRLTGDDSSGVVLIGKIIYEDGRGLPRQTGFCRVLKGTPQQRVWERYDDPEYEFSY